jgi:hypothetical protein
MLFPWLCRFLEPAVVRGSAPLFPGAAIKHDRAVRTSLDGHGLAIAGNKEDAFHHCSIIDRARPAGMQIR